MFPPRELFQGLFVSTAGTKKLLKYKRTVPVFSLMEIES